MKQIFDINLYKKTIFIFTGIPASGKTSFRKMYFSDFNYINLDELKTRNKELTVLQNILQKEENCIIDNTNVSEKERKYYINIAKQYNYKTVCIYFRSVIDECLKRNKIREPKIPDKVIIIKAKELQMPKFEEGFDEMFYVKTENGLFNITKWDETK